MPQSFAESELLIALIEAFGGPRPTSNGFGELLNDLVNAIHGFTPEFLVFTAKGQLLVGTGNQTGETFNMGTAGQVLTVGGLDPGGLEWATVTGTITDITSADHSVTITGPTGPTTDLSVNAVFPLAENGSQIKPTHLPFYNVKDYGATGNGVTDDTTAIQNTINACALTGGVVLVPTGTYVISSALSITANNVGLWGMGTLATIFTTSSTTIDFLDIAGPGTGGTPYLTYVSVRNLSFARSVAPSTSSSSYGIKATWTTRLILENLEVADSTYCYYCQNTAGNLLQNCEATQAQGTSGTRYGFYIDGSSGQNQSIRVQNCIGTCTATANGVTTYAFYLEGPSIRDCRLSFCETASPTVGLYINATSVTNYDVHVIDFVCDQYYSNGIFITGASGQASITILDGWTNPLAGASNVNNISLSGCHGVIIQGHQFFCDSAGVAGNVAGVRAASCHDCTIAGNIFTNFYNSIVFTGSTLSTISHNMIFNGALNPALYGISFDSSCSRVSVVGNVIDGDAAGAYTTGVNCANGADFIWLTGNTIDPGAMPTTVNLGTSLHNYDSQSRDVLFSSSGSVTSSPPTFPGPVAQTVVGHYSVTTTAGGQATVTFPTQFPTGLLTAIANVESSTNGNFAIAQLIPGSSDNTKAVFLCSAGGVALNAQAIFLDVIAYGW